MFDRSLFNPAPVIETVTVGGRPLCHVIDNALLEPERWVEFAAANHHAFRDAPRNAFPGPELALPEAALLQLEAFFSRHLRQRFEARRTLSLNARLSIASRRPEELQPRQWLCHIDRMRTEPGQLAVASVLYLFRDESLGGTGFYRPLRPLGEIMQLMEEAAALPSAEFGARHGLRPAYMVASNAWFEKMTSVPAKWNRLIFYSGTVFHSGDITAPERLCDDPRTGRLTLNGFFTCRRNLA
ncbi:DUF6445 family protein [Lysobacter sp. Root494]|uniref:DUF6445 family protein n=1 Tax=Lysobacter sp. Root494 TaxID=1736549 RepID=UPI0006FB39E5|nr:DUF6445 family protein [Lysobacter sp. Root494]KQY54827.1 hypothetical protein ASD14_01215 [Lysobacter sp. Root494]